MDGRSLDLDLTIGGIPCSTGGDRFDTEEVYGGGRGSWRWRGWGRGLVPQWGAIPSRPRT